MPTLFTLDIKKPSLESSAKEESTKSLRDDTAPALISTINPHRARGNINIIAEAAASVIIDRKRPPPSTSSPNEPTKRYNIATTPHGKGPWSHEENVAFRRACLLHGIGNWTNIAKMIPSRTATQVKSHAQKMKIHQTAVWEELVKRSENGADFSNLDWPDDLADSNDFAVPSEVEEIDIIRKKSKPRHTTSDQDSKNIHRRKESLTFKPRAATNTWTKAEHLAFCRACCIHGVGNWKRVSELIPTRSAIQVKSHAQKVKLHKPEEWKMLELGIFDHVQHEEGRDDEKHGEKVMEERSVAVDQQLEIAGNLLLLASGDGDYSDSVGGSLPTDACVEECCEWNNRDCTKERYQSRIDCPQLGQERNVSVSHATAPSNTKASEMKYSRNEAHRNRSVMGYDATTLSGKESGESNSDRSYVLSRELSLANMKCEVFSDNRSKKSHKKCAQEIEPVTLTGDDPDCNTNASLSPDETIAEMDIAALSNESQSFHGNGVISSGSNVDSKDAPQNGAAISSPTTKLHNPSLSTLRSILSTLSSSELSQVVPSKDHQIEFLRKENESLKATIAQLHLKLAMEKKKKNDWKGYQAINGTKQDASVRAGFSALKVRGKKT
ncbi:hypothetical protein HJC23_006670 [Cyclotella cryptica]|uniref:Uncharacterized protein n=1 Tax=Cyclotella cryptica TaxID=29204 RepID=A0ABD3QXC4_9STRA|eukprot:CCRYP_001097-RA/>CCRYP_001097-RA protein AED:0.07 eAED:0.07 QI:0/-1/0/1/-1/1/1/0/609